MTNSIMVNSLKIGYEEYPAAAGEGSGADKDTLVLILHGWGCTGKLYESISTVCSEKYRVIAPDLPGHGNSSEPSTAWDCDAFADFVLEFLKHFEFKRLILIGHSNGGRIIIRLLAERELPFEVSKVVLIDSAGIRNPLPLRKRLSQRLYKLGKGFYGTALMKKLSPNGLDNWRSRFGSADYKAASPVMRSTMVKLINEDLREELPKIKAETLMIWGEKDTATPLSDAKLMEKLIPGSGLVVVPGAGHFSFTEAPVLVARVLRSFLFN